MSFLLTPRTILGDKNSELSSDLTACALTTRKLAHCCWLQKLHILPVCEAISKRHRRECRRGQASSRESLHGPVASGGQRQPQHADCGQASQYRAGAHRITSPLRLHAVAAPAAARLALCDTLRWPAPRAGAGAATGHPVVTALAHNGAQRHMGARH